MLFSDRTEAGRRLAPRLAHLRGESAVVLGIPRGGVPVAFVVAEALAAPLDVVVVRKLGLPHQPELAMGAVGEGGVRVVNENVVRTAGVRPAELAATERRERAEVESRARRFRGDRPRVSLAGSTAIVVDDGIATGSTMSAACQVLRAQGVARVVVAVPVAPEDTVARLRHDADEVVCVSMPRPFYGVGQWYDDFAQTSDAEVTDLLDRAARRRADDPAPEAAGRDEEITVPTATARLPGHITVPRDARGLVLFAHGSGSSRHSPRNRQVATVLNQAGLGTLLLDLLTPAEGLSRVNVFDIALQATRLTDVTRSLTMDPRLGGLATGYFGASTGAAAALVAAAEPEAEVAAVVSRGGRPDLAGDRLRLVRAPTLLIVGGDDEAVLQLNREARDRLRCPNRLAVVPGATHLFEEPGALDAVADLATDWFRTHLIAA